MSSVWFAVPSKRPPEGAEMCLAEWRKMGYKIALWRDPGDPEIACDLLLVGEYKGYHVAVNTLCREILARDPDAEWIVTGGDDMKPDPHKRAEVIAYECGRYFGEKQKVYRDEPTMYTDPDGTSHSSIGRFPWSTFGVMQPTGDMKAWPESHVDKICGSPWMGREFCRRMYGGNGPFWHSYYHMYGDEEMHEVCKMLGILWNRADLSHYHHHWIREAREKKQPIICPDFLVKANAAYDIHKPEFAYRKAHNWPGHEPLPEGGGIYGAGLRGGSCG